MPTTALDKIDVGGPCKVVDPSGTIYFEEGVTLTPSPGLRAIMSSVAGEQDDVVTDLFWTIKGRPKAVWTSPYRATLLPSTLHGFTVTGGRVCGSANRTVSIVGSDSKGFDMTRCALTKMPRLFLGVGESLYDEVEWTAFIGQGKAPTAVDAFYAENTTAWSQADFPTTHQEELVTAAWGAVTGWDTVWAEKGFTLTHELKLSPVKSGNITVDQRVTGYRAMLSFLPEEPTSTQLLAALALQGASAGIGTRRSANAADMVVAGASGFSVTVKSAALNKGAFVFDNKMNRPGEFGMIGALTTPGTRLVFA